MSDRDAPDIFAAARPRVFSIDAERPFLKDLAAALRRAVADPLDLADCLIFTPTRRAAMTLADTFADIDGRAGLLPRIRALGDIEEDALFADAPFLIEEFDLAPAVAPLERRLVLARMVVAADRQFAGQDNWPAALGAAEALAALLDSLYTEELDFSRLDGLVPADHAGHWEMSLKFLRIVSVEWPRYLQTQGLEDPSRRRAILLDRLGALLARKLPATPVIVAGTTGSAPAVARLMSIVARLPKGAVVLPGLDRGLAADARGWEAVDDQHGQAGVKAALAAIGVDPACVSVWPGSGGRGPRQAFLSLALRPAQATSDWLDLVNKAYTDKSEIARAVVGLTIVEARDEEREAAVIALCLRRTLETPGRTAMLVTPDRDLGRRVAAKMRRWDAMVEDSAGVPLGNTGVGTYLRLVADWLIAPADPVRLLSLARHPAARFGLAGNARASAVTALDRAVREPATREGLPAFAAAICETAPAAAAILGALQSARAPWPAHARGALSAFLDAHIEAGERLAADNKRTGAEGLWRGAEGAAASILLGDLRRLAPALGDIAAGEYPQIFAQLVAGKAVRRAGEAHPRLAILGPLEARLQSADLVILGGLNEGVWPGEPGADPFLSRQMRRQAGLPSPERRIGLAAHDFAQAAAAPEVVLTRARMSGGSPARPSRWIVRLRNILAGAGAATTADGTTPLADWAALLDRPDAVAPATAPRPTPPAAVRPRRLSVTGLETLMRDPYAIYGRYILGLKPLGRIGEPIDRRHFGLLLHAVFEDFVAGGADPADPGARARLQSVFDRHAARIGFGRALGALWAARLAEALDWFLAFDRDRRRLGAARVVEGAGAAPFAFEGGPFTLSARADRIDILASGGAEIFDYKSGAPPTLKQVKADFSPQLPLTALIVEAGGFAEIGAPAVESFTYLKALGRKGEGGDVGAQGPEARAMIDAAQKGFRALIDLFDDPDTPYLSQPRPQYAKQYAEFDHLARRREWAAEAEDGPE